jgi:hypothetical protein
MWHPLSAKVATNFSSFANSGHGVFFYVLCPSQLHAVSLKYCELTEYPRMQRDIGNETAFKQNWEENAQLTKSEQYNNHRGSNTHEYTRKTTERQNTSAVMWLLVTTLYLQDANKINAYVQAPGRVCQSVWPHVSSPEHLDRLLRNLLLRNHAKIFHAMSTFIKWDMLNEVFTRRGKRSSAKFR